MKTIIEMSEKTGLLAIGHEDGEMLEFCQEDVEFLKEQLNRLDLNRISNIEEITGENTEIEMISYL